MMNPKRTTSSQTSLNTPNLSVIRVPGGNLAQMRRTLDMIGQAIVDSSRYLPIRNRAAALASRAGPRDYLGQVKNIYADFVRRWRYVRDPYGRELLHTSPKQVWELVMGGRSDSPGVGLGRGAGDCDDATIALGAQLASIGFPVRLATIAPMGLPAGPEMSHIFTQAHVPGHGWISVDPVVWPRHGLGYVSPHSRLAIFDLRGKLLATEGNAQGLGEDIERDQTMQLGQIEQWTDYAGFGDALEPGEVPLDYRQYGVKDFGIYAEHMGMLGGMGIGAEVDTDERGLAWTPMIEVAPHDYRYLQQVGAPYHGMLGLSDLCEPMVYDGTLGFFKRLFKRIKSGVKRVVKRVAGAGKSLLAKIPGGKYLIRLGQKVWGVAKKLVKPLARYLGPLSKLASKIAPIAAMIPGYGPAIAAGLATAGKIGKLLSTYKVAIVGGDAATPGKLRFKSDKHAKAFQAALSKEAAAHAGAIKTAKSRARSQISRGIAPRYRSMMARIGSYRRAA